MDSKASNYFTAHQRLSRKNGKAPLCIWGDHVAKRFEWANVTGFYTDDIQDYLPMCPSCHRKFDFTEETRRKMSQSRLGKTPANTISIAQLKDGKVINVFRSTHEASRSVGILATSINNNVMGRSRTSGGYTWKTA